MGVEWESNVHGIWMERAGNVHGHVMEIEHWNGKVRAIGKEWAWIGNVL